MINNFSQYPSYKDSGVEWLGEIPEHWDVLKIKRVFYEVKKRSNVSLNCGSISFGKVVYKDDEKIPESTKKSYQVVLKGDFLVNPLNLNYDLISLRIALSEIDVVVSSGYIVLNNSVEIQKKYYKYFLHRFDVAFMKLLGSGVRQTLNWNDIANCDLIFPPLPEQTAIAQYLDEKTALIDKAIDIKQKQIALLKERRQVIIQQAVTRGLDPNVKMKDSGVEWIGEIPEEWEVKRIKHVVEKAFSGGTPSTDKLDFWDGGIPWASSVDIKSEYLSTTTREISALGLKLSSAKIAPKGSILFVTRSGILQHTFAISISQIETTINQDLKCLILNEILLPEYFQIIVNGNNGRILVEVRQQAATVESIDMEAFYNLQIPLPKVNEQMVILEFCKKSRINIGTAISLKEKEIEKLMEYRATLINSAVTGKIKVITNE